MDFQPRLSCQPMGVRESRGDACLPIVENEGNLIHIILLNAAYKINIVMASGEHADAISIPMPGQ